MAKQKRLVKIELTPLQLQADKYIRARTSATAAKMELKQATEELMAMMREQRKKRFQARGFEFGLQASEPTIRVRVLSPE